MRAPECVRVADDAHSSFRGQIGAVVLRRKGRQRHKALRRGYVSLPPRWEWLIRFEEWPDRPLWFTDDEVEAP